AGGEQNHRVTAVLKLPEQLWRGDFGSDHFAQSEQPALNHDKADEIRRDEIRAVRIFFKQGLLPGEPSVAAQILLGAKQSVVDIEYIKGVCRQASVQIFKLAHLPDRQLLMA